MKQKWQCAVDKTIHLTAQKRNKLEQTFESYMICLMLYVLHILPIIQMRRFRI